MLYVYDNPSDEVENHSLKTISFALYVEFHDGIWVWNLFPFAKNRFRKPCQKRKVISLNIAVYYSTWLYFELTCLRSSRCYAYIFKKYQ